MFSFVFLFPKWDFILVRLIVGNTRDRQQFLLKKQNKTKLNSHEDYTYKEYKATQLICYIILNLIWLAHVFTDEIEIFY